MKVSTLLLLIASSVCVSSSPLTTELWTSSSCRPGDLVCSQHVGEGRGDDPLTNFRIADPQDGAVKALPIRVRFYINTTNTKEFNALYADVHICAELNGRWKKCKAPGGPPIVFSVLPEGNYTATAYMTNAEGSTRYHETEEVAFRVLSSSDYKTRNEMLVKKSREEQQFPEDIDLLHWAELGNVEPSEDDNVVLSRAHVSSTRSPMLVIGVKTEVVTSFPRRQAIRESWANPATLPHDVKVLFLGGEPNMTVFENDHDRKRVLRAVAKERAAYRDLLTEELECIDSYRNLANKVKAFMHLAAAEFPQAKFVMLVDDDIYLKVGQLTEHLRRADRARLYFGEVWAVRFANRQEPIRNPASPYHLPRKQYPMRGLLPYASGPHYAVSMDGIRFIAKNYWKLRTLNGLEDVSSGLWLKSIGIDAEYSTGFSSIRSSMACEDNLVSFADLSPLGIRSIHANLANNRSFCHGFDSATWHRHVNTLPRLEEMLQRPSKEPIPPSQLLLDDSDPEQVTVIVSTRFSAGMKLQFTPPIDIQILCKQVQQHFPSTSPSTCQAALQLQDDLPRQPLSIWSGNHD
nr:Beta-1,3-galactosyltransferase 1 [Phytophthora ramorum]